MTNISESSLVTAMNAISGEEFTTRGPDDPLDRNFDEIGFDSLARQELMGRIERAHGIRFSSDLVLSATSTPRELLIAAIEQEDVRA
ncbi:act minimal PKS acyl carrier protein [Prauserella isguenensis]|uniref:Act minimal PKS acyl carrier protein n=1 Tax=Prauserella isguenensis TaxID=1470180 RepID=A0A839S8V6_9PSEU|nr:acyl carrier protein [Prauserella isguenensis]MBB3053119.1 act minimal PKS acyl carrier protein [Prauserella isguenensis]